MEEIGIAKDYVNPDYELPDSFGMHGERLAKYVRPEENMFGTKETVAQIGIAKGFKPYQVTSILHFFTFRAIQIVIFVELASSF